MNTLLDRISTLHISAYKITTALLHTELANAGNIGIFCQDDEEYEYFLGLQKEIALVNQNPLQKYFPLKKSIVLPSPITRRSIYYTHLYIRKPDPSIYGRNLGDIDFYVSQKDYDEIKSRVELGLLRNTDMYLQTGVGELIQIQDIENRVLAYISTRDITEKIRFRYE